MGKLNEINVEEYLMNCARDLHDEDNTLIRDPDDIELVCEDIIILYAHARGYEVTKQHRQFAESFYEWTQGLPYNFFDYHYYDPRPTYKELFGERKEIYDDLCEENEDIRSKITFTILDTILLHVENVNDLIKKNTH
jgi:hypothetical protein